MADVPQLSDGIVMLDAFTLDDVSVHLAGEDEEQARRFGWYPRRSTEATVRDAFARWEKSWEREGETRAFAMRDLMSRELVGGCEIRLQDKQVAEISYWTYPSHRQKGYATRAVRLASEFSFKQLGVARIEAYVEPDNRGSRRVVERAGFSQECIVRSEPTISGVLREMVRYCLKPSTPGIGFDTKS